MIARNLDIDTNSKYIILYKLKSDGNVVACSCSEDNIIEKCKKLKDDSGLEIIGIYERSVNLEEQIGFFFNKTMPGLIDFFSKFDTKNRKENTNEYI